MPRLDVNSRNTRNVLTMIIASFMANPTGLSLATITVRISL